MKREIQATVGAEEQLIANDASELVFSADDKTRLRNCGLTAGQVSELERNGLPIIRTLLRPRSSLTAVRSLLVDLENTTARLLTILHGLEESADSDSAGEASNREVFELIQAQYHAAQSPSDSQAFEDWLTRLVLPHRMFLGYAKQATADFEKPKQQRRKQSTMTRPIAIIDELLRRATVAAPSIAKRGNEAASKTPSASNSASNFREIVGICYATVGATEDPKRAIENYIKSRNASSKPRSGARKRTSQPREV